MEESKKLLKDYVKNTVKWLEESDKDEILEDTLSYESTINSSGEFTAFSLLLTFGGPNVRLEVYENGYGFIRASWASSRHYEEIYLGEKGEEIFETLSVYSEHFVNNRG